jgi:hypothetical protein
MHNKDVANGIATTGARHWAPVFFADRADAAACCAFRIADGTTIDALRAAARGMSLANFLRAPSGAALEFLQEKS